VLSADGFTTELRSLIPDGLTMTVTGHWRHWRGPVGCGKRATLSDVWYLAVDRILSPSPLARVTLTPANASEPTVIAQVVPTTITGETIPDLPNITPGPTEEEDEPGPPTIGPTMSPTATRPPITPATPTTMPGTTPSLTATSAATAATNTPATPDTTPTATTGTPGTPPTSSTATPTLPPGGTPTVVDKGEIQVQDWIIDRLEANQVHSWLFVVEANTTITVSVSAAKSVDAALSILDSSGTVVQEQNQAPAGQVESIAGLALSAAGDYEIRARTATGAAADYALTLLDDESFPSLFRGILGYGEGQAASLAAGSEHLWHFSGNAGDNITITVTPNDNSDLYVQLYDPAPELLVDIDSGFEGEPEELPNFALEETGFYTIIVSEFYGDPSNYTIALTGN
jgi:hypothetical protein